MLSQPSKSNVNIHFQPVAETYPQKYRTEPESKGLTASVVRNNEVASYLRFILGFFNHFFSHEQNLMN